LERISPERLVTSTPVGMARATTVSLSGRSAMPCAVSNAVKSTSRSSRATPCPTWLTGTIVRLSPISGSWKTMGAPGSRTVKKARGGDAAGCRLTPIGAPGCRICGVSSTIQAVSARRIDGLKPFKVVRRRIVAVGWGICWTAVTATLPFALRSARSTGIGALKTIHR
jgi:hypothetical protein